MKRNLAQTSRKAGFATDLKFEGGFSALHLAGIIKDSLLAFLSLFLAIVSTAFRITQCDQVETSLSFEIRSRMPAFGACSIDLEFEVADLW